MVRVFTKMKAGFCRVYFCSTKCIPKVPKLASGQKVRSASSKLHYKPFKDPVKVSKKKEKDDILEQKYLELLNKQKEEDGVSIQPSFG